MRPEKITWGLFLVFLGSILLLSNLGIIDFYWQSVWRLWPVIFIIVGLNIILSRYAEKGGNIIAAVITIFILAFVGYQGIYPQTKNWNTNIYSPSEDHNTSTSIYTEPYLSNTKFAELNIKGGAATYKLSHTTTDLFEAKATNKIGKYSLVKSSKDSSTVLNFEMRKSGRDWSFGDNDGNDASIKLNTNPIWDITIKIGAGETNFDLRQFKVRKLDIQGGAASYKIKLGIPLAVSTIRIETSLSETNIKIPESAPCKIYIKTGLSSQNFDGFKKLANGTYITENYNESVPHFEINLKGGVADFKVSRY